MGADSSPISSRYYMTSTCRNNSSDCGVYRGSSGGRTRRRTGGAVRGGGGGVRIAQTRPLYRPSPPGAATPPSPPLNLASSGVVRNRRPRALPQLEAAVVGVVEAAVEEAVVAVMAVAAAVVVLGVARKAMQCMVGSVRPGEMDGGRFLCGRCRQGRTMGTYRGIIAGMGTSR